MKYLTIKAEGNNADGLGAQIQRRISTWAYCKLKDIKYIHTPMFKLEHNYDKDESFETNWESFFNLGHNELTLDEFHLGVKHGQLNQSELLYEPSMNKYFDENGVDLYDNLHDDFFKKYFLTEKPELKFESDKTNIAVHVRRGDLMTVHHRTRRKRFTSDEYFISVMSKLNEELNGKCKFYLYSQTPKFKNEYQRTRNNFDGDLFEKYRNLDMDVELVIDGCPFSDFHHLMMSDVLVTSKSSFSYLPAMFTDARVIYNKFWHEPKSYWEIGK